MKPRQLGEYPLKFRNILEQMQANPEESVLLIGRPFGWCEDRIKREFHAMLEMLEERDIPFYSDAAKRITLRIRTTPEGLLFCPRLRLQGNLFIDNPAPSGIIDPVS
jgi:hypothetical protein